MRSTSSIRLFGTSRPTVTIRASSGRAGTVAPSRSRRIGSTSRGPMPASARSSALNVESASASAVRGPSSGSRARATRHRPATISLTPSNQCAGVTLWYRTISGTPASSARSAAADQME